MPQSLSLVIVHIIFSTKERRPFLDPAIRPSVHAYLAMVARNAGCECYRAGGVEDHIHHEIRLSRTIAIAFQEEFRMFLDKYGVEYNEACVWD